MVESLALRNAQEHIRAFAGESEGFIDQQTAALDCRDCEAFLQMGIDAFDWLERAEHALRAAAAEGAFDYTAEVVEKFKSLAKWWLRPCDRAERWIKVQLERGFSIANLDRFRQCHEEMLAIVAFDETSEQQPMPEALIALRDAALREFHDGETAEFVP